MIIQRKQIDREILILPEFFGYFDPDYIVP